MNFEITISDFQLGMLGRLQDAGNPRTVMGAVRPNSGLSWQETDC